MFVYPFCWVGSVQIIVPTAINPSDCIGTFLDIDNVTSVSGPKAMTVAMCLVESRDMSNDDRNIIENKQISSFLYRNI
jgi:hypothetical protein